MHDEVREGVAASVTPLGKTLIRLNAVDWRHDTIKVFLARRKGSPERVGESYRRSGHFYELRGTAGYAAGGMELSGRSVDIITNPLDRTLVQKVVLRANPVQWPDSTISARYAYAYDASLNSGPILYYVDFGRVVRSVNDLFEVVWNMGNHAIELE